MVKQKIEELRLHGRLACGGVATTQKGDSVKEGDLKIEYTPNRTMRMARLKRVYVRIQNQVCMM